MRVVSGNVRDVNELVYGDELPIEIWGSFEPLRESLAKDPEWRQGLYYLYIEPERRRP